jgi:hypothetical protein
MKPLMPVAPSARLVGALLCAGLLAVAYGAGYRAHIRTLR